MEARDVIVAPHISEESMEDMEDRNLYTFEVDLKANKPQIKKAVEEIFEVKVNKVTTCRMPGKKRRRGYTVGSTPEWKKARVKLAEGDTIDVFEGV
jgi:large subunit ribosomal protein L23